MRRPGAPRFRPAAWLRQPGNYPVAGRPWLRACRHRQPRCWFPARKRRRGEATRPPPKDIRYTPGSSSCAEADQLYSELMTRRRALALVPGAILAAPSRAGAQRGMASRNVTPTPMGKPSGRPFHAHFVNVAQAAGLRSPVIYGPAGHADYVLEVMGCGAAFLDYDNDGWLDIILLTGRRFEDTPEGAAIRLYHNNRDGTFSDVSRKSGLSRSVWATGITVGDYDNDGFDDVFITCWRQNILFHNNVYFTDSAATEKAGL